MPRAVEEESRAFKPRDGRGRRVPRGSLESGVIPFADAGEQTGRYRGDPTTGRQVCEKGGRRCACASGHGGHLTDGRSVSTPHGLCVYAWRQMRDGRGGGGAYTMPRAAYPGRACCGRSCYNRASVELAAHVLEHAHLHGLGKAAPLRQRPPVVVIARSTEPCRRSDRAQVALDPDCPPGEGRTVVGQILRPEAAVPDAFGPGPSGARPVGAASAGCLEQQGQRQAADAPAVCKRADHGPGLGVRRRLRSARPL